MAIDTTTIITVTTKGKPNIQFIICQTVAIIGLFLRNILIKFGIVEK